MRRVHDHPRIKAQGLFVARHRFKIFRHEVFRPVARWLDGEIGIAFRIDTGVAPHRGFVVALLLERHAPIEGYELDSGIALLEIEASDIAPECVTADGLGRGEQSPHRVQDVGVGLDALLDAIFGIVDSAFKFCVGVPLELVCRPMRTGGGEQQPDSKHRRCGCAVAGDISYFRWHA